MVEEDHGDLFVPKKFQRTYSGAEVGMYGLLPGDLLLTRSKSLPGWAIRLGAAFSDKPNIVNHVIIVDHVDKAEKLWGIEGRPGGVGWKEIDLNLLKNPYTMDNRQQPKTIEQRQYICDEAQALIGTPYDWLGIVGDGFDAVGLPNPWDDLWEEGKPAHVVCSSAADYIYKGVVLDAPVPDRNCKPTDWAQFWIETGHGGFTAPRIDYSKVTLAA